MSDGKSRLYSLDDMLSFADYINEYIWTQADLDDLKEWENKCKNQ